MFVEIGQMCDGGDVGGDVQDGVALERRFQRQHPDQQGLWSVVTVRFYVASAQDGSGRRWIEQQTELMICRSPQDHGATEQWCDYRYIQHQPPVVDDDAAWQMAVEFQPCYITWDGRSCDINRHGC